MKRFNVGTNGESAKKHAICEDGSVHGIVYGRGYQGGASKGWSPESEAMAKFIVDAMNEKHERDAQGNAQIDSLNRA